MKRPEDTIKRPHGTKSKVTISLIDFISIKTVIVPIKGELIKERILLIPLIRLFGTDEKGDTDLSGKNLTLLIQS